MYMMYMVNARVFYPTADRFGGGFGLVAEWTPVWAKRSLSLRGCRWTPSGPSWEPGHPFWYRERG